ncbi:MAG: hypothetical protein RL653_65 [Pseudomonadota bacterium]
MPAAYSMDLRIRVVETADELGLSDEEAAETFKVGEATVRRWRRLMREKGDVAPLPHNGGPDPKVAHEDESLVRTILRERPDATIQEIRDEWARQTGKEASRSSMVRALGRLGVSLKKRR